MTGGAHPDDAGEVLDERTERALAALLAIPASDAAGVRDRSPSRRRPQRQHGPVLDLGREGEHGDADDGSDAPAG